MFVLKNSYLLAIMTYLALWVLVVAAYFPYHYDSVAASPALISSRSFYNEVYSTSGDDLSEDYVATEIDAATAVGTETQVKDFVARYDLRGKKALEVGSGRGTLQASYRLTGDPTRFHYRPLTPNYRKYWVPDSDAVNAMDQYEAFLWFISRGDECLDCSGLVEQVWQNPDHLTLRIRK